MSHSNDATSIYNVSVDSRSRPRGQSDNSFTLDLGRTLHRVKTVQLAAMQFPDSRYAFDDGSVLEYSEPIYIEPNTYLKIQQTTKITNKVTNAQTTNINEISVLIPPTLNPIIDYDINSNTVSTQYNHGLSFSSTYYPLVGLNTSVVGAAFPQSRMTYPMPDPFPQESGPILNYQTITVNPNGVCNQYKYVNGYLEALTNETSNFNLRHIIPGVATSYIYTPKPTLVELFTMINAALSDVVATPPVTVSVSDASNTSPIVITTPVNHGFNDNDQVVVSGVTGNTSANGTYNITITGLTTFELNGSIGNNTYNNGGSVTKTGLQLTVSFGFNDEKNSVVCVGPVKTTETRVSTTTISAVLLGGSGTLADLLGFSTACLDPPATAIIPQNIVKSIPLRHGNYTATQVCSLLNYQLNPLLFEVPIAQRTFHFMLSGGTPFNVVLMYGRYTVQQVVDYLNVYLNCAPANIQVSYNALTQKFTFRQKYDMVFGMIFNYADGGLMSINFGFEAINYDQHYEYTSVNAALFGVTDLMQVPENSYNVTSDATSQHFTFDSNDLTQYICTSGTNTEDVGGTWGINSQIAFPYKPNDVFYAQNPYICVPIVDTNVSNVLAVTIPTPNPGDPLLVGNDIVTITGVQGNTVVNGTWRVEVHYEEDPPIVILYPVTDINRVARTAGYINSTGGILYSVTNNGIPTNTYTTIIKSPWDASVSGLPSFELQPTVSMFSTLDNGTVHEALQTPQTLVPVSLKSAQRNVFQLLFSNPDAKAGNFGFPPIAWPPSTSALQTFDSTYYPVYNADKGCVPVSGSYTAPFAWTLTPPDYILVTLANLASDMNSHSWNGDNRPILAKLQITAPYLLISENFLFNSTAGFDRVNQVTITFYNPDWTPCRFNGKPINFNLIFTMAENSAKLMQY